MNATLDFDAEATTDTATAAEDAQDVQVIAQDGRLRVLIPGKPQTGSFRFTQAGRRYTPRTVAEWRGYVRARIAEAVQAMIPKGRPVELLITLRRPKPAGLPKKASAKCPAPWAWTTKPDLDNIAKPLNDALKTIAYADDNQVTDLILRKRWGEREEVEICVRELAEGEVGL